MSDENLNERDRLTRRSSILKTVGSSDSGDGDNGQRRVSFAANMKVKTFDEAGCNTSELIPHALDNSDMSLVNMTCEKVFTMVEGAQEHQTEKSNGETKLVIQPVASVVLANVSKGNSGNLLDSSDSEESEEDNVTGDILNQQTMKKISNSSAEMDISTNGESTGDVLKQLGANGVKACGDANGLEKEQKEDKAEESESDDEPVVAAMSDRTRMLVEKFRKTDKELESQVNRTSQLCAKISKEAAEFAEEVKSRPICREFKK